MVSFQAYRLVWGSSNPSAPAVAETENGAPLPVWFSKSKAGDKDVRHDLSRQKVILKKQIAAGTSLAGAAEELQQLEQIALIQVRIQNIRKAFNDPAYADRKDDLKHALEVELKKLEQLSPTGKLEAALPPRDGSLQDMFNAAPSYTVKLPKGALARYFRLQSQGVTVPSIQNDYDLSMG